MIDFFFFTKCYMNIFPSKKKCTKNLIKEKRVITPKNKPVKTKTHF